MCNEERYGSENVWSGLHCVQMAVWPLASTVKSSWVSDKAQYKATFSFNTQQSCSNNVTPPSVYRWTTRHVNTLMQTQALSPHLCDRVWDFGPRAGVGSHWASACEEGSWGWSGSPCGQVGGLAFPGRRTPCCLVSWAHSWVRAWAPTNCLSDDAMGSWHSWVHSSGLLLLWTGYQLASFLCFSVGDRACLRMFTNKDKSLFNSVLKDIQTFLHWCPWEVSSVLYHWWINVCLTNPFNLFVSETLHYWQI